MSFPPPNSGSGISSIIAGPGLAGGTITTSGTISLGTIAVDDFLANLGTVADVPTGHSLVAGTNVTITAGNTISASGGTASAAAVQLANEPILIPGGASAPVLTTSGSAFAIKGNKIVSRETTTITGLSGLLASVVNGGSYTAYAANIDSGNVVLSVTGSNTIVATGTNATEMDFTLNSGVVCLPGSIYAMMIARIDSTGTFVLPTITTVGSTTATGYYPGFDAFSTNSRFAGTVIANGTTLDATGTLAPYMLRLFGRLGT